jgi:hypothetical protein
VSPSIATLERLFQPVGWEVAVSFFPKNSARESAMIPDEFQTVIDLIHTKTSRGRPHLANTR